MDAGRRYLLVDDNSALVENLAEILGDSGATVDVALAGADALEQAARHRYDALVSDMRMPVMSGAELVRQVRRIDPELPVIVVTAYADDDELSAAAREGLLAVLPKPTPIARLLALLSGARRGGPVAIVESDVALCHKLTEALQLRGFSTVTAQSIAELDNHLGSVPPALALVDLRIPGGPDGTALARLGERFSGLPMVVVTDHADLVPSGLPAAVFTKPFSTTALLDAVEQLYPSCSAHSCSAPEETLPA